jgi:DNA-binding response OmpR family regulator
MVYKTRIPIFIPFIALTMKKILLYSSDFVMSFSFLMFLQNRYNITLTTDLIDFELISKTTTFDIILMDAEPTLETELICRNIQHITTIPVILLYVYRKEFKEFDKKIRQYVKAIFYKPFDILEVKHTLDLLTV